MHLEDVRTKHLAKHCTSLALPQAVPRCSCCAANPKRRSRFMSHKRPCKRTATSVCLGTARGKKTVPGEVCSSSSQCGAASLELPLAGPGAQCTALAACSRQRRERGVPAPSPPAQRRTVHLSPPFQQRWHQSSNEVSVQDGDRCQLSRLPPGNQKTGLAFVWNRLRGKKLGSFVGCKSGLEPPPSWAGSPAWFGKQMLL